MVTTALTPMQSFSKALNSTGIAKRLGALMSPKQTERFKSTLTQIVTSSPDLLNCTPNSVIGAGAKAAAIGLDISPVFGYACILPYRSGKTGKYSAQFQLMVNGWIQLAMRSGAYDWINADAVYDDEYKGSDLISGEVIIESVEGGYRDQGRKDKIVGFFAAFRLLSGSKKVIYWSIRQIEIHARTYSKSYKANHPLPIPNDWQGPNLYSTGIGWENGWYAMAVKTMIKQLLRKWGPLSTEMQEAIEADEGNFDDDGEISAMEIEVSEDGEIAEPDAPETPTNDSEVPRNETIPEGAENAPEAQESADAVAAMFEVGARR